MVDSSQIQAYLKGISRHYKQWRQDHALTNVIAHQQAAFTFKQFVQTEERQSGDPLQAEIKTYPLFEGIYHYLLNKSEHVLLVGSPGVGKSSALWHLLDTLAKEELEATEPRIPVLVQLKAYRESFISAEDPHGLLTLIKSSLRPRLRPSLPEIDSLLCDRRLILLLDGLNEIPAGVFRTHLQQFRDECRELEIPLICSTREMGGGDLGIQRKLEIQPLNSGETDRFLQECLPEHQDQVRQLLQRDNRDLSRTPFVLWMLYHLLKETGTIAETLGEAFRKFFRDHCRNYKEDAPVSEERRKAWNSWMEHLAFTMLSSPDPLDPGLVINKEKAENILAERFGELQGNGSRILELEKYYLLAPVSDRETSFKHQLIQEYYAAECLLEKLKENPELLQGRSVQENAPFQIHYLNYLKWTQTVSVLLGLLEQKEKALEVISLALNTDFFLGATLSKDIPSYLQPIALQKISELDLLPKLKMKLLGITKSSSLISTFKRILKDPKCEDMYLIAVHALGMINNADALSTLEESLEHYNVCVRLASISMARYIDSKSSVKILIKALVNDNETVREFAISQLSETRHRQNVRATLQTMSKQVNGLYTDSVNTVLKNFDQKDQDASYDYYTPVIMLDATFLRTDTQGEGDFHDNQLPLLEALQSEDSGIQLRALYRASSAKSPELLPCLRRMLLKNANKNMAGNVTQLMKSIQLNFGIYNYNAYLQAQKEKYCFDESEDRLDGNSTRRKEYRKILSILHNMSQVMERDPESFFSIGEEAIRSHFLAQLNGTYKGQATGETFNKLGKPDIVVRLGEENVFIGECKFWGGESKLRETLDQLLGYATWHDDQLGMLIFNRNKNFSAVLKQIPDIIKRHSSFLKEETHLETQFHFIVKHPDDPERELKLAVLAFDIPTSST